MNPKRHFEEGLESGERWQTGTYLNAIAIGHTRKPAAFTWQNNYANSSLELRGYADEE